MPLSGPDPRLAAATGILQQGRPADALALLAELIGASPHLAPAHYLRGVAYRMQGDARGSVDALRTALRLMPQFVEAAVELARLLNATGAHRECIEVTTPLSLAERPPEPLLVERARAFQAMNLQQERLAERERIARLSPAKAAAHHNLAAALGDAGYPERAERSAREALARNGAAPETWLVLARALQAQHRLDDAEEAFRQALRCRAGYAPALRDRAQLVWMRTGELERALAVLDAGAADLPHADLVALKARMFKTADQARRGYETLVAEGRVSDHAEMELAAADLASGFDPSLALSHALRAERLAPASEAAQRQVADSLLAAGRPSETVERIERLMARHPLDQHLIASRWLAWRMLGDERAGQLYDYATMVAAQTIDTPPGWDDLPHYLSDLASVLRGLHGFGAHPVDQSLRHGTQSATNLLTLDDPVVRAFQRAIARPIREYLAFLGTGADPLRARNRGGWRIAGMWSVQLRAKGFHLAHVHPMGWISSACYVDLPAAIGPDRHDGWISFGKPGIPTTPPMEAEHRIQPREGTLVLFPSYMWHGTEPFAEGGTRLTIAFDLVPDGRDSSGSI